ncbi:glycoside hydrolase family 43 protein [Winogradskyella poriferorum]|uniref:Glycoside hydrolase family 43 protein n=1 Tax=Winogradskyella poriferorum TaxID=307627 RepID=A0ABU7W799_9FLAO
MLKNKPSKALKVILSVFLLTTIPLVISSFTSVHNDSLSKLTKPSSQPIFKNVVYTGNDDIYKNNPLSENEFYNPILQGCYPDPAITKKGDDYYMVCSSFAMFPGVPIFHSKDLVNWSQIGHVLDRPSQLDVSKVGISHGVYAPGITYNPNNDTFYMITTVVYGVGNMVVKTKDPMKGWSEPYKLNFSGIDPSIFFDDDGKAYVVHNDAPDEGKELYSGHRVIKVWEYDLEKDDVIPGTDKIVVNGGVDINEKPIWIEAPHLYKKDGFYYLMCAEGGTGGWHSEVIFKSDKPTGPFVPAPSNPILTQRYFAKDRQNKVDWAGHADLVQFDGDQYYGVFLAVRPNEENRVNTGRETFILPVDWSGEFPVFENGLIPMKPKLKLPVGVSNKMRSDDFFPNGNFTFQEDFSSDKLDYRWIGLRGPREAFISKIKEGLKIKPFDVNIKERKPTSTLFHRQQHNSFTFSTTLSYRPESEEDLAGVVALQNEGSNYVFGVTKKGNNFYIVLQKNKWPGRQGDVISEVIASSKIELDDDVKLEISANGDKYEFKYAVGNTELKKLGITVSGDILSTDIAGGFTGCLLGLYATSANDAIPN